MKNLLFIVIFICCVIVCVCNRMFKIMFKWVLDDSKANLGEGKYAWTIKYPILTNIKKTAILSDTHFGTNIP